MVKAKEFLKFLCEDLDYRFFSGVPCLGFKPIYDSMSSKFMHYVPAVNERSAFGISMGAAVAGAKSAVLVDSSYLSMNSDWFDFCKDSKQHILVITNREVKLPVSTIVVESDFETLKDFIDKVESKNQPGILVLSEIK